MDTRSQDKGKDKGMKDKNKCDDCQKINKDGYCWPYRINGEGTAVLVGKPSPEPSGDLNIPGELGEHPVTAIGDAAFAGCSGMERVTIPDGVTMIDDEAFYGCEGLTELAIPASVVKIGRHAFCGCRRLKTFNVAPDNQAYVFEAGFLLTKDRKWLIRALGQEGAVRIPAGVKQIEIGAFSGCAGITSVTIPDGVTTIWADAFEFCTGLTTVTIPRSVTMIDYDVFYGCPRLTTVRVSVGDTERVRGLFEENTSADVSCEYVYEEV